MNNTKTFAFIEYGFAIISILLNLLVIIIFKCAVVSEKYSIPNLKLYLQAIIDLILSFGLLISAILLNSTNPEEEKSFLFFSYSFLYESSKFISVYMLLLTALSSMTFCHQNNAYVSEKRFVFTYIGVLILSIIPEIVNHIYIFSWESPVTQSVYDLTGGIVISITIMITYVLLIYTYDCIYKSKGMQIQQEMSGVVEKQDMFGRRRKKEHHRLVLILLCTSIVYALNFLPQFIFSVMNYNGYTLVNNGEKRVIPGAFYMKEIFKILYFSRAFIDPLLTLLLMPDFYLCSLLQKKEKKKTANMNRLSARPDSTMSELMIETNMQKRLITFETAL